jgi:hypothetical protein
MVPQCVQLEDNGACTVRMLGAAMSVDGKTVRVDFYDRRNQVFPIAMSERDLCELLRVVGYMSQEMAAKQEELGAKPDVTFVRGQSDQPLPPLRVRLGWSAANQSVTIVIGNAGLQFPMDANTAKSIGQALVDQTAPYTTGGLAYGTVRSGGHHRGLGAGAPLAEVQTAPQFVPIHLPNQRISGGASRHHLFCLQLTFALHAVYMQP